MTTCSILHATLAILIGANLIVCIKTYANSKKTQINIEPLSSKDFSSNLRNLLSPDVFAQADPFHYLLGKTMKFSFEHSLEIGDPVISEVNRALSSNGKIRFPPHYVPYAKLLSSLLPFAVSLRNVYKSMVDIQSKLKNKPGVFLLPDINSLDPEISQFFASDVFADTNAPTVLVDKLLKLPENSFPRVAQKFFDSINTNKHIRRNYYDYSIYLSSMLSGYASKPALINLQSYVSPRNANGDIVTPAFGRSKLK